MWSYILRCCLQKRPHLYIYKIPTYTTWLFCSGNPKHTYFFYLALLNMRNTLKEMTELTYAELTQGRESTRLPHTHKITSLKNAVILLCIKLINEYIFKPKCNCRRKSMQEKEPIMIVWCKLKVPSLRITIWHHSASLAMLNSYCRDRIFNPQLTAIKNSFNKVNV